MQPTPDIAALFKIAQSPAGQKLLSMLHSANAAELDSITAAAAAGKLEEVMQKLTGMLSGREAQELLKQLEKQL